MKRVSESSFLLAANGHADSPPASGVRDWLVGRARRVTTVFHPLNREDPPLHRVAEWRDGVQVRDDEIRLPSKPPLTFALDPFAPLRRGRHDVWLGFSNLSALHGVARRRAGLVDSAVYWAVDFVPDRFGTSRLTRLYDLVDRAAATRVDLRVELTAAARDARAERLGLGGAAAPTHVAPIGIWLDRVERTSPETWKERRVVFIGHLVPRQGVAALIRALALLRDVRLDIAGRGPDEEALRDLVRELGLGDRVRFHGFLADHREVERLVASAAVAAAPYATDPGSFTRYADPSKLRTYAGAGVPIVLTDVPPNAHELAERAGAELVDFEPGAIAAGVGRVLASPEEWQRRRSDAIAYAAGFDWNDIVGGALRSLGFSDD